MKIMVILGGIVIVGVLLLFYYQLGTDKQDKLKSGFSNFFSGIMGGPMGGGGGGMYSSSAPSESGSGSSGSSDSEAGSQGSVKSLPGEEKVLYIFGDGAREERPLGDADGEDKNA